MTLELVTLSGPKLQAEVYEVILPTADGEIAVFPLHMPLVTNVIAGVVTVRHKKTDTDEHLDIFATNGGVAEVTGKAVRILVDEADRDDEIIESEAREALERAQKLKQEAKSSIELAQAQASIDRQAVRLKVAELHKHRAGRRPRV
jgi:F-type H+-transporting ATPase subunit epsilon